MASIRKRLSVALGLSGEASPPTSKAINIDTIRRSFDSGYNSMIAEPKRGSQDRLSQATTFVNPDIESSPSRSPRKLHKAISTTFSGAIQSFSNTVRSTTSYIYPTTSEPELPSSEWAECETPKKQSRRSSIMSSVRSRTQRFTPRARDHRNGSRELPNSPVPSTRERAPALHVDIPNPSLSYESLRRSSISRGSQLLAGVKLPATAGKLWPGPTRMTVDQALGNDRRGTSHAGSSTFDDPYVEHRDGFQHGLSLINSASEFTLKTSSPEANKRYLSDDKGYLSEAESNADVSDSDWLAPACLKYVAPGSLEARTSSPCRHKDPAASRVHVASSAPTCQKTILSPMCSSLPLRPKPSNPETLDGTAKQTALLHPRSRRSSHRFASLEDGFNALFSPCEDGMTLKSSSIHQQLSSDAYDADAESLGLSMGSRNAWERHRADRERRYMEIIDMAPATESDEEVGPELELERSPSKKSMHYAEELVPDTVNKEGSEFTPRYPTGDLRYAVEAIERLAFPVGDLAYAVEAIERPSIATFDPLETVLQQRPMLRLSDTITKQEPLQVSDPQVLSPSLKDAPSSLPAGQSPSRVELPSSPESSPVDLPAAPKYTMTMMELTDEEFMTFRAGKLDDFPPGQQSRVAPEDAYEAGLRAERLLVPTYLPPSSKTRAVGEEASERASSPDDYNQAAVLEQHDFQSPSAGTRSSIIRSPSNTIIPQETSNAAKLPSLGSPSPIASRKARRKQKKQKSSSGMKTLTSADLTIKPRNTASGPDFSPSKRKLKKSSPREKLQTPLGERTEVTGSSVQRSYALLEEFIDTVAGSVMWLDPASKSKSSKRGRSGKGQVAAALPMTISPARMKIPRVRREPSSGETHEYVRGYAKDSWSRFEPEFSIKDSMSDSPPLFTNQRLGSTSCDGYELYHICQESPSVYSRHEADEDRQQDNDAEAVDTARDDVTIGNDGEQDKDASRAPGQEKNGKPPPELEKESAVQRELELKSYCAILNKLMSEIPGDDHVRGDDPAQKEARSPGRP